MRSDILYYGVRLPDIRRICRPIVAAHPIESARAFDDTVEKLFVAAAHREVRYAAVKLAKHPLYRARRRSKRPASPSAVCAAPEPEVVCPDLPLRERDCWPPAIRT